MLYGRDAEVSRITEVLDGARESRSAVLVIRGEAGVGKSALLENAREQASDMRVLRARGIESEAALPYAGLHQLLRPVLGDIDALPPPQARALRGALGLEEGASDEWFLVSLAVLTLLAEASERRPLLCLVDDAHWLDAGSAASLVFGGRRLGAERVVLLFAAREGDVRTFEAPDLEELWITGLEPDAADALLGHRSSVALSREARDQLIAGTGGNPLALLELSATLNEDQLAGAVQPLPVSARVEDAFLQRVRTLPDPTQTLLLVAAADEVGGASTVLRAAAQLGAGVEAFDAAEEAGLLRVDGARLEFRHPLVRSAVYHGAPLSQRQAAHRALASALDADDDRRAWHRAAASLAPDAEVVEELERAGSRARQRSGFIPASLAYERAAALATDERHRVRLLTAAGETAWFGGRPDRAEMLLERALPGVAEPAERADIDFWRALIEVNVGVPAEACEMLMRSAPDMATADVERGLYMLCVAMVAATYGGEPAVITAAHELSTQMPEPDTVVARFLALLLRGAAAFVADDFVATQSALRAALDVADAAHAAGSARLPGILLLAGGAAGAIGDDDAAHRLNRRLVDFGRDSGAMTMLTQGLPRLAVTQIANGQWSSAQAGLDEGMRLARQSGQHQVVAHMQSELALLSGLRGDDERCRELARASTDQALARRLLHVGHTARWALLLLELSRGHPDAAVIHARELTTLPLAFRAAPDRIEAAVRAGDAGSARPWLEPFVTWAESSGAAWALAAAAQSRALLCEDDDEAESHFVAALDLHADAGRPFDRARTELAFGEHLRRARRRLEAREHLRAALDGFEALGAAAWADRVRTELRASGQTARKRDASTLDELTAQELQIAAYVAEGLSNRDVAAQLFLSPRTIDFHLRNVFRKLGISSRIELARLDFAATAHAPMVPPVRA